MISKVKSDFLGVDANGRSFRWTRSSLGDVVLASSNCKYSVYGVPPQHHNEKFIWNNSSASRSSKQLTFYSLEKAWENLGSNVDPFKWKLVDGEETCWPRDAIGEAVKQNIPDNITSTLALAIPNHLEESGQDMLLRGLGNAGVAQAKLIWRPIAIALHWLNDNNNIDTVKKNQTTYPKLWVIDLESSGLEVTSLTLREKNGSIIPVRECPQKECDSWMSYTSAMQLATRALGGQYAAAQQLLWGGYGAEYQSGLENAKSNGLFWIQDNLNWRSVRSKSPLADDVWKCDLKMSNDDNESPTRSLTNRLLNSLPMEKVGEGDMVLWHGWPARLFPEYVINLYKPAKQYIMHPDSVARGAANYIERLKQSKPTYLDTLPSYGIWAQSKSLGRWDFIPLIPEDTEVDGGMEYQLPKVDGFYIKKEFKQFPLILRRGSGDDCRSIDTELPEIPKMDIKLKIGATMRPASGFASVIIESADGQPLFRRHSSIKLNWDNMNNVPLPKQPAKTLRVAIGYPPCKGGQGRILTSDKEYARLRKYIDEVIVPAGGLNNQHIDYLNDNPNRSNFYLPWGWPKQTNVGLFGPHKTNDQRILNIADEFGALLFSALNTPHLNKRQLYKLMGYMYSYTPEDFIDHLAGCFKTRSIKYENQIIAAGRVFTRLSDFDIFVDSFVNERLFPDRHPQWYIWSFMRCLCYYEDPAQLSPDKAIKVYRILINYLTHLERERVQGRDIRRKFVLSAMLFGLRIRHHHADFIKEGDPLRSELSKLISSVNYQTPFPPTMFKGMGINQKADDNLNRYVNRFLNCKETAEDQIVAGGLAAD